ncbi:MAG: CvpA family protein, partial [Oscillospiraceae bacterium]|nr:CvpA family protein [Oscillospiraceae bacterium]
QIVATGSTVAACEQAYISQLKENNIQVNDTVIIDQTYAFEQKGVVEEVRSAVLGGTTYYYFRLAGSDDFYRINAQTCERAVIVNVGDRVTITGNAEQAGSIREAETIS